MDFGGSLVLSLIILLIRYALTGHSCGSEATKLDLTETEAEEVSIKIVSLLTSTGAMMSQFFSVTFISSISREAPPRAVPLSPKE